MSCSDWAEGGPSASLLVSTFCFEIVSLDIAIWRTLSVCAWCARVFKHSNRIEAENTFASFYFHCSDCDCFFFLFISLMEFFYCIERVWHKYRSSIQPSTRCALRLIRGSVHNVHDDATSTSPHFTPLALFRSVQQCVRRFPISVSDAVIYRRIYRYRFDFVSVVKQLFLWRVFFCRFNFLLVLVV